MFRHVEKQPKQAIVQKLSRLPSGLRAATTLCDAGLFQEQATVQRVVDEIGDDVIFLSMPMVHGLAPSKVHEEYLESFFQEPFDDEGKPVSDLIPSPRRKKIRAYIAAHSGDQDTHRHVQASKAVHGIDSGYVHANSSYIMDTYGGSYQPHFHTAGMLGTPRERQYRWHLENYYYRALVAFGFASAAFDDQQALEESRWHMNVLDQVLKASDRDV